mmetsp:Transcript_21030/g.49182  ORF Transcript_21030/g.49182 Transcript_21030/m.49182 type:complete len:349 (-) Transcript_21030:1529-2575(-)
MELRRTQVVILGLKLFVGASVERSKAHVEGDVDVRGAEGESLLVVGDGFLDGLLHVERVPHEAHGDAAASVVVLEHVGEVLARVFVVLACQVGFPQQHSNLNTGSSPEQLLRQSALHQLCSVDGNEVVGGSHVSTLFLVAEALLEHEELLECSPSVHLAVFQVVVQAEQRPGERRGRVRLHSADKVSLCARSLVAQADERPVAEEGLEVRGVESDGLAEALRGARGVVGAHAEGPVLVPQLLAVRAQHHALVVVAGGDGVVPHHLGLLRQGEVVFDARVNLSFRRFGRLLRAELLVESSRQEVREIHIQFITKDLHLLGRFTAVAVELLPDNSLDCWLEALFEGKIHA